MSKNDDLRFDVAQARGPMPSRPSGRPSAEEMADRLYRLVALRAQGVISDEEFAVQKLKLLG